MSDYVLSALRDRVLTLSLNNPDQRNAWNPAMEQALRDALTRADANPEVRVIILTGAGTSFCPGPDTRNLQSQTPQALPPISDQDLAQRYSYFLALRKPLIAAINGAVAGVGLCLTLYCDMRFMIEDAKGTTAFARRGLIAEHGSAWMLPRLIGPMNAADLLLTGRTFTGRDAEKLGLVRALPREGFLDAVETYARDIARNCAPRSLAIIKQQLGLAMSQSLAEATTQANRLTLEALKSEDFSEGIRHFVEKRPANFVDLS